MVDAALARHQTVVEIVRVYEDAVRDVRQAFASIHGAEGRLNEAFRLADVHKLSVRCERRGYVYWDRPDDALEQLNRDVWRAIVDRLELRRALSIARAKELDEQIERGELPAITVESVMQMAERFHDGIAVMAQEAVREVFEWLRPRGWAAEYKTNSEFEIGPKVILPHVVERAWMGGGYRVYHRFEQNLRALENVFSLLDGRGPVGKTHRGALWEAIDGCGAGGRGETEYFTFRCFRNGNLHLSFKRLDLLAKLNRVAGGKRLRASDLGGGDAAMAVA